MHYSRRDDSEQAAVDLSYYGTNRRHERTTGKPSPYMRMSLPSCSAEAALRHLIYIDSSCLDFIFAGPPRRPGIRTAAVVNPLTGFPTSVWLGVASRECHDAFLWSLGDVRTCHPERTSLIPRESITPIHRTRKKAEK